MQHLKFKCKVRMQAYLPKLSCASSHATVRFFSPSVRFYNIDMQSARNEKWHIIAIMCVKCTIHVNP